MRSRLSFLVRLATLKFLAFVTFIALAIYMPRTANLLLDGAGDASKMVAAGTEDLLQSLGNLIGDANALMPRQGTVSIFLRLGGMEKVILFIAITIMLYLLWVMLLAGGRGVVRIIDASGNPRVRADARVQTGPPR